MPTLQNSFPSSAVKIKTQEVLRDELQEELRVLLEKWSEKDDKAHKESDLYHRANDIYENLYVYESHQNIIEVLTDIIEEVKEYLKALPLYRPYSPSQFSDDKNIYGFAESINCYSIALPHNKINGKNIKEEKIEQSTEEIEKNIEEFESHIIEHAIRKIELFFYLLVAYYGTRFTIELGETKGEHGRGSRLYGTQAAHSGLFSSVTDNGMAIHGGANVKIEGYKTRSKGRILGKDCFYKNSYYFEQTLDATVELPVAINSFDRKLEGTTSNPSSFRKNSLKILNAVSQGKETPEEGIFDFIKTFQSYLTSLDMQNYLQETTKTSSPSAKKLIYKNFMTGTLDALKEDGTLDIYYIYMLLRIPSQLIQQAEQNPQKKTEILEQAYANIGNEIKCSR